MSDQYTKVTNKLQGISQALAYAKTPVELKFAYEQLRETLMNNKFENEDIFWSTLRLRKRVNSLLIETILSDIDACPDRFPPALKALAQEYVHLSESSRRPWDFTEAELKDVRADGGILDALSTIEDERDIHLIISKYIITMRSFIGTDEYVCDIQEIVGNALLCQYMRKIRSPKCVWHVSHLWHLYLLLDSSPYGTFTLWFIRFDGTALYLATPEQELNRIHGDIAEGIAENLRELRYANYDSLFLYMKELLRCILKEIHSWMQSERRYKGDVRVHQLAEVLAGEIGTVDAAAAASTTEELVKTLKAVRGLRRSGTDEVWDTIRSAKIGDKSTYLAWQASIAKLLTLSLIGAVSTEDGLQDLPSQIQELLHIYLLLGSFEVCSPEDIRIMAWLLEGGQCLPYDALDFASEFPQEGYAPSDAGCDERASNEAFDALVDDFPAMTTPSSRYEAEMSIARYQREIDRICRRSVPGSVARTVGIPHFQENIRVLRLYLADCEDE